jgi:uncharacterized membrane protein
MDPLVLLATWIHTVAFVIAWGYYGVLGRIILPGLAGSLGGPAQADVLAAIEARARPLLLMSVILFTITGTYLLVIDPEYAGLGNVLTSTWTVLMFAKHAVILGLVILAVAIDRLVRRLAEAPDDATRVAVRRRLALSVEGATALGAVIALLTVGAQANG